MQQSQSEDVEDHDIDITLYDDLISNNEYFNGMPINILIICDPLILLILTIMLTYLHINIIIFLISAGHDHRNNYAQIIQQDNKETHSHIESTNTLQICSTFKEKGSKYKMDNVSIFNHKEFQSSFGSQNQSNFSFNNVTVSTSGTCALYEEKANIKKILHDESRNLDFKLVQDLGAWAVKRNVTLNALSHLLKILKKYNHKSFPMCAQTLLRTPRNTLLLIRELENGGQFWYYGILSGLKTVLSKEILKTMSDVIEIDVFFDGFSPYGSIRRCLWPIAGCIASRNEVFIIAIWCGETKCPLDLDAYLEDFINETLKMRNGFNIDENCYKLKIRNIIADAPARAWLKCVNQHGHKFACER